LSARKQLDIVNAYRQVGTYRGAAEMCGVTHKTVRRLVNKREAAEHRVARRRNYESVRTLVAAKVENTKAKISAKRLLPEATAAGYEGSDRNFRRLPAQARRRRRCVAGVDVETAAEDEVLDPDDDVEVAVRVQVPDVGLIGRGPPAE